MNFSDLARSGTAPSAAKNKTNQILSNNIPLRPKTRGGDNDFVELNYDLRNNKIGTSWGNNQNSLHETDDFSHFKKRQEVEEYEKAMESFHAAVDNWSGKKDVSGGLDLNRRPDSRNKVSKDPKKSQNIYLSGLSAYTQNVPNIILQTSKKTSKVSSTGSPRVRDPKSSNSHMNELRAAYGADFTVGTSVKPKSAKSANQYGSLKSYQEENVEASALRSSTANRVMVVENSGIPNRPKTQGSSSGRSALPTAVDSGALSPAKKPLKKPSLFSGGAQTQQMLQQKPLKYFDGSSEVGCVLKNERSGSHPVEKCMWGTEVDPVDSDLCCDHVRVVPDEIEKAADRHGPYFGGVSRGGAGALQHAGNRSVVHLLNGEDDERGDDTRGSAQQEDVGEYGTVRKTSIAAVSGGGDDGATGGSESTATVALERPQSRKLYLGNEKSVLKTTIKAPRSAGARYSNFSPTKGTPTNVFEMNGSEGEVTRQASLKRMSSFSGLTQPAKPWSEDDHLPVRRPPSRQSSAFPVHLADVPAPTTSSSTGAQSKDSQVIHSKSSNGSSFKRRKDEALALVLMTSANSSPPTAGVDLGDRVDGLSHRPPSRQKLAAQHLFEGLHSASQQSSVADLHAGRDGDKVSDAPMSSAPPSSAKPAAGRATKGRTTSSSRTVSGLYYNPRDDGFSELDTNGSGGALLPFAITVNYGSPVGNMMPVDGDADYVVVDQNRHVPSNNSNSAHHRRSENGNGAQRRSDTKGTLADSHRFNDCHESHELMALSSAASELSLISATVHEGQAPRGNRPAAGSWDFAESGDTHSSSRRPVRPKSVASIAVSSNGSGNRVSVPNQSPHLRTKTAGDISSAQSPGTLSPTGRVDGVGWTSGNPFRGSSPVGKPPTRESSISKEYRNSLPPAKSPVKNVFGGTAWAAEGGYTGGSSMRALSSACNSPANFSSDTRDFIQQDDDEDELCGEDLDEDMVTIMTEDSGHSRGDSPLSMRSFTLESSLGEDFLNLFAPAGMR